MPAPLDRIETSPTLPGTADAVVIGAGIVGVCAAYYLVRRGLRVALLEKGVVGGEQSSRNWGWCRQQNRDARELPISTASLALWDTLAGELGEDPGFSRCGLFYLSDDEAELAGWARWGEFARGVGVTTQMLTADAATQRGAATGRRWRGGVFSPTDGVADPARAAPVIARGVMKFGGSVHQGCAARGLELTGGRVSAVVTERGTIRTDVAVLAAGAWASAFLNQRGVRFPQASVRSSILSVAPGARGIPDALHTKGVSVTRRGDGGFTLAISGGARLDPTLQQVRYAKQFVPMFLKRWRSLAPGGFEAMRSGHETLARWRLDAPTPMEAMRVLDPTPDAAQIRKTHERAKALLPGLADSPVQARWAGYIDSTPDGVPAIGEVLPGLVLAAGFSGHGFGIGPGAGHLIADLLTGAPPIVDPTCYAPQRLAGATWGRVAEF